MRIRIHETRDGLRSGKVNGEAGRGDMDPGCTELGQGFISLFAHAPAF